MSQEVMSEYIKIFKLIGDQEISQEEFIVFFKKVKALKKLELDDDRTRQFGCLVEGILYNMVSRFDHSYPLIQRFKIKLNDAVNKIVEDQLAFAKEGSEFVKEISKINNKMIPWYSHDPVIIPMYNYFYDLESANNQFYRELSSAARVIFDQIKAKNKEISEIDNELILIEENLNKTSEFNLVGWIVLGFGFLVCFASGFFGFLIICAGFMMGISNQTDPSQVQRKNELIQKKASINVMKNVNLLAISLKMSIDSPNVPWSKISNRIIELTGQLERFVPKISYSENEVMDLREARISSIKDHLKRQLAFKSSKLLRAPAGFNSPNWQDDILTTVEPLLYQYDSDKVLENAKHFKYMTKSNVSKRRIIGYKEFIFSTNSVQTIYLFDNKLGILNFVYDLISDQVIFDSYKEIYYRHITSVDTKTVIIEEKFAKEFLIRTSSSEGMSVNFINKEDFVLEAQLRKLEEQRERLLASTQDGAESGSATDILDDFGIATPNVDDTSVKEELKLIDEKILKLKEKPFMKDIQGLEMSKDHDDPSRIPDNIVSMVTDAIESYLGTIQVSEAPRL